MTRESRAAGSENRRYVPCLFVSGIVTIASNGRVSSPRITKKQLGRDLYEFVAGCTASELRMPGRRYRPSPEFLQWRLDNPEACYPDDEV